jgi:hypothetical protein
MTGSQGFLTRNWEIIPRRFPIWPCLKSSICFSWPLSQAARAMGAFYPSNCLIMDVPNVQSQEKNSNCEEKLLGNGKRGLAMFY